MQIQLPNCKLIARESVFQELDCIVEVDLALRRIAGLLETETDLFIDTYGTCFLCFDEIQFK